MALKCLKFCARDPKLSQNTHTLFLGLQMLPESPKMPQILPCVPHISHKCPKFGLGDSKLPQNSLWGPQISPQSPKFCFGDPKFPQITPKPTLGIPNAQNSALGTPNCSKPYPLPPITARSCVSWCISPPVTVPDSRHMLLHLCPDMFHVLM